MLAKDFASSFGVNDRPPCPHCGQGMYVSRRSPAAEPGYELQLLSCEGCGERISRTVDEDGKPKL